MNCQCPKRRLPWPDCCMLIWELEVHAGPPGLGPGINECVSASYRYREFSPPVQWHHVRVATCRQALWTVQLCGDYDRDRSRRYAVLRRSTMRQVIASSSEPATREAFPPKCSAVRMLRPGKARCCAQISSSRKTLSFGRKESSSLLFSWRSIDDRLTVCTRDVVHSAPTTLYILFVVHLSAK